MWLVWLDVTPVLPNHILPPIVKSLKSPRTSMKLPKCAIKILWNPWKFPSSQVGTSPQRLPLLALRPQPCAVAALAPAAARAAPGRCAAAGLGCASAHWGRKRRAKRFFLEQCGMNSCVSRWALSDSYIKAPEEDEEEGIGWDFHGRIFSIKVQRITCCSLIVEDGCG